MKYLLTLLLLLSNLVVAKDVLIQKDFKDLNIVHKGKVIDLQRNQDRSAQIMEFYRDTWRGKIQPLHPFKPHPVETVAELEVINYIEQISQGDDTIVIVDTRPSSAMLITGMIPTAIHMEYKDLVLATNLQKTFATIGVTKNGKDWNFDNAKTLVLYCNGFWCGKSPKLIRKLLKKGYPAEKLKYYRGGMQAWRSVGLTTVEHQ